MTPRRTLLAAALAGLAAPAAAQTGPTPVSAQTASATVTAQTVSTPVSARTGETPVSAQATRTPVPAAPAARAPQRPQQRRAPPQRRAAPAPAPAQAAHPLGDPAPVPNRDLELPRAREAPGPTARLDPTLIDPAEPRFGTAVDRNNLQAREDRLLRQPAPGARLRLPFAY
jgi:hypothetical protein